MKKTKFTKFDAADYLTDEEGIAAYLHEVLEDLDRIQINPDRMNGQPTIRDLRLTVHRVLELVELYPDRAELKAEFPELEDEDIQQVLALSEKFIMDDLQWGLHGSD